jgi:Flp pilus assembly protein TadG
MAKRRNDAGQTLAVVAVSIVVILGFLGLGLDVGYMRSMRRRVQLAADAAAIAGATELPYCSTSNCSALTTAAQSALTENGFTSSTLITGTSSCSNLSGLTIIVNNPPLCAGSTSVDPNYKNPNYVEVVVSQVEPTVFAHALGVNNATIVARSEAALPGGGNVLYALDQTDPNSLSLFIGIVNSNGGVVVESNSSSALDCSIGLFSAPYIGVVGKAGGFFCGFPEAQPTTGIQDPTPQDPLAYLQPALISGAPSPTACVANGSGPNYLGSTTQLVLTSGTHTLSPGTYCGGISISNSAKVTLNPGIYTLSSSGTSTGGLSIDTGATVTGNGVGFYNYGPIGGVNFTANIFGGAVSLTAPNATNCSGCATAWQGILFFQADGDTTASTVFGSTALNVQLTGISYFPTATVNYALDFGVAYNELVAKQIRMGLTVAGNEVDTHFYNNFTSLANGNPIKATGGALVE